MENWQDNVISNFQIEWNQVHQILFVFLSAPESLTIYCRSLLDAGRSRFLCPYISQDQPPAYCGVEWDYIDVRRLAVLTDNEIKEFERKISKNYLIKAMGIQECPKCNSMVERSNKKHIRVVCPICSKINKTPYEFCWHCLREWANGSSTEKCGGDYLSDNIIIIQRIMALD